ncbi:hypothetical protein V8C34DRAFT_282354 [Trichoderma compactum]
MGGDDGLPQLYNRLMADYRKGYAFYDPESSRDIKPGMCGYIDGTGSWHGIVDVTNSAATDKGGFSRIQRKHLGKLKCTKRRWGPMYTDTVNTAAVGLEAGATRLPAGIPVEASALVEFSLKSDFGAVLLCRDDVSKHYYMHLEPFRNWVKENSEQLLSDFPTDLKKYGFYVVLNTFTATDVLINGWRNEAHKITLGYKGQVAELADLAMNTDFYGAHSASGWVQAICEGDEKVVFFGGLRYECSHLPGWLRNITRGPNFKEVVQERWAGDNLIIPDPEVEEDAIEITDSSFGELG